MEKKNSHRWLEPLNNDMLSIYQYGSEVCEPSQMYGPYVRDHFLIHFVKSGSGKFSIGDLTYNVGENQGFIIYPDEITYYEADKENPWTYRWIGFNGGKIDGVFHNLGFKAQNPIFNVSDGAFADKIFKKIEKTNPTNMADQLMLDGYLYMLFSVMTPTFFQEPQKREMNGSAKEYVEIAIEYIKKNYSQKISVSSIAYYIGLNRSYLGSLFKKHTKMTPVDFIMEFRMKKALELLSNDKLNISDVARNVGYDDAMLFSKNFKKRYGLCPTEYREKHYF